MRLMRIPRCAVVRSLPAMPTFSRIAALRELNVRMSFGAFSLVMAVFRCSSVSEVTSERARSSSAAARASLQGPSCTFAGFAPKNAGVVAMALPPTIVQFCEM